MAARAVILWRSITNRGFATATTSKMNPFASTTDIMHHDSVKTSKGEFIPVYVALGLIALSVSCGALTAKHQIAYNPSVRINKKRRETVPEVEDPDRVVNEADKFINKSLFRKVAHIQDMDEIRSGISDPTRPDPFNSPRRVETLKTVGVDPRGI